MPQLSMYRASVTVPLQILTAQLDILNKAAAHCAAKKIDEATLINMRLFPDMFPLARQIRVMTGMALAALRIAGVELPKFEDNETTFEQLKARISKVIDLLKGIKPEQVDGSEDRDVVLQMMAGPKTFKSANYLLGFAMPNFYFHATTTYNILRHCGVELGKKDFMGDYSGT